MNPTSYSQASPRETCLKLAAGLYVGSRVLLLGVLVAVPLVYWRMGLPEGQVTAVAGGVVVLLGMMVAHLGARSVRCVVCRQPCLRHTRQPKHPYAGKWLGISHRGRVAWDVLTATHHHCMYCHTRCRNQGHSHQGLAVPETRFRQPEILRHFPGPMAAPATEDAQAGSSFAGATIFDLGLLAPAASLAPAAAALLPVSAAEVPPAPSLESWLPALPGLAEVAPVPPLAAPMALEPAGPNLPSTTSIPLPPIPAPSAPLLSAASAFPLPAPSMFPPAPSPPSPFSPFPGGLPTIPAVPAAQGNPAAFPLPALPYALPPLPAISAPALPAIHPPAFPPVAALAPSDSPWSAKPEIQETKAVPPPGEAPALPPASDATPASMEALLHILQQGRETMEAAFLSIMDQLRDAAGTMALPIPTSGEPTAELPAELAGLPVPALPLQTFPLQPLVAGWQAAESPAVQEGPVPVPEVQLAELPVYPPLHPVMPATPSLPPVLAPEDLRGAGDPPLAGASAPVRRRALSPLSPYLMAQLGPTLAQAFTQAPDAAHGMEPAASLDPVSPPAASSPAPGSGFPTPFLMPPVPPLLSFVPVPPNAAAVASLDPAAEDETAPGVPDPCHFLQPATPAPPAWPTDDLADLPQSEGLPMWTRSRGKPSLS